MNYYNNYYFETKNKEIVELTEIIKSCSGKYEQYLKDFDEAKKMNKRYQTYTIYTSKLIIPIAHTLVASL